MSTLREIMASAWCGPEAASGPAPLDWVLVGIAGAIVSFAFFKAALHTLRPGERERTHIKWRILDEEDRP
jgi:hypothetical protein